MDNMEEISLVDLNSISGGALNEKDIKILDMYIKLKKWMQCSLEEAVQGAGNPEAKEYIKEHW